MSIKLIKKSKTYYKLKLRKVTFRVGCDLEV
jgi:hypothetical protein